jgi:hypothetical protein
VIPGSDDLVTRELASDERLIWSGGPEAGIRLRPADALMIPFSLFWGGFAFFWEYSVVHIPSTATRAGGAPAMFMALWGIPFVVVGLYLIVGRFFADAYLRSRTRYGVTDQRVLIVTKFWNRQVKSVSLRTLGEFSLQERADGSGSITFGSAPPFNLFAQSGWPGTRQKGAPAFEFVKDVRSVYELIRRSQEEGGERRR